MSRSRKIRVLLHRYVGLSMAAFLFVAGITGSMLAFRHEVDAWLNSELAYVESRGAMLPPQALIDAVEEAYPEVRVTLIPLKVNVGNSAEIRVEGRYNPDTGKNYDITFDRVYVDPINGKVLGTRSTRTSGISRENFVQLVADLHSKLKLGANGRIFMGIIACLWVFDSFVSVSLTFPGARPFFRRWRHMWTMKFNHASVKSPFNWHRVIGLWMWILLLPLAISSVYMNFPASFVSGVESFSKTTPSAFLTVKPDPEKRYQEPKMTYQQIIDLAENEAKKNGWNSPGLVFYNGYYRLYGAMYRPTQYHRGTGFGDPFLCYDADTGELVSANIPGDGSIGDRIIALQRQIHSGDIVGLPGRIAVCILGLLIAVMSVTGPLIWWKKHRSRKHKFSGR